LVVEVDGGVHIGREDIDEERQKLMETTGLRFVRVSDHAVRTDMRSALQLIAAAFADRTGEG
jgi:very-short-patch-repair endonuclease